MSIQHCEPFRKHLDGACMPHLICRRFVSFEYRQRQVRHPRCMRMIKFVGPPFTCMRARIDLKVCPVNQPIYMNFLIDSPVVMFEATLKTVGDRSLSDKQSSKRHSERKERCLLFGKPR